MGSDGFNNSIVGGIGALIRQYIKSPNYVAGVSGWSINKDGSAEFNDATFRGTVIIDDVAQSLFVYSTNPPAAGKLILALAPQPGVDPYGNVFNQGLTLLGPAAGAAGALSFIDDTNTQMGNIIANTNGIRVDTINGNFYLVGSNGAPGPAGNGLKIYAGPSGRYCASYQTFSQAGVVTATFTTVTNRAAVQDNTDYAGVWAAHTFTAPVDSFYDISAVADSFAGGRVFINIRINGVVIVEDDSAINGRGANCSLVNVWLNAGDTVDFRVWQNTGANQTVTGRTSIARKL